MKKTRILSFVVLLTAFGLTSCLKEYKNNVDLTKGPADVIEFANTGSNAAGAKSTYPEYYSDFGVKKVGDSDSIKVNISYSGADVAPEDITVNLALDQTALDKYNSDNGTDYVAPPTSIYSSIPSSVVIKKGAKMTSFTIPVQINSNFDFSSAYALPLKISSASKGTVSGNFGKAIYSFGVRNKYDGVYEIDGSSVLVDIQAPGNSSVPDDPYPYKVNLVTTGATSVKMNTPDGDLHYIANGSAYGEFDPVFTFDNSDKIVSVTNLFGQPSPSRKRSAEIDPSGANKQNADKSIDVKYYMYQAGALKTTFSEHLKYVGPR